MNDEEKKQLIEDFHRDNHPIPKDYEFSHFSIYCKSEGIIHSEELVTGDKPKSLRYIDEYLWDDSDIISINAVYLNPKDRTDGKIVPFFYLDKKTGKTMIKGTSTPEKIDKSKLLKIIEEFN
jgi:hypothetical protein